MADVMAPNKARFTLEELGDAFGEKWRLESNWQMEGVVTDSRQAKNGNIFFAIEGERFDGHKFLSEIARIPKIVAIYNRDTKEHIPQFFAHAASNTVEALGDLARFHRQRFDIPRRRRDRKLRQNFDARFDLCRVIGGRRNFNFASQLQ